jgi:hypothetical protein
VYLVRTKGGKIYPSGAVPYLRSPQTPWSI